MKKFIARILGVIVIFPLMSWAGTTYCPQEIPFDGSTNPGPITISNTEWDFTSRNTTTKGTYKFTTAQAVTTNPPGFCNLCWMKDEQGDIDCSKMITFSAFGVSAAGGGEWDSSTGICGKQGQNTPASSCLFNN